MQDGSIERSSIFVSYSHRDTEWLARLRVHLRPLERDHPIRIWDDTMIRAGSQWRDEIEQALVAAKVAVLIVSADFLASDFVADSELPTILEAARSRGVLVLPLLVSPSRFARTPGLSTFQAVNDPERSLVTLTRGEQEAVLVRLSEMIESALVVQQPTRPAPPVPSPPPPPSPPAQRAPARPAIDLAPWADQLRSLRDAGGDDSFLIVSSGGRYVQFAKAELDDELLMEAVSSAFLPDQEALTPAQSARLTAAGFEPPAGEASNFARTVEVGSDAALAGVAALAWRLLTEVYGCAADARFDLELDLGTVASPPPKPAPTAAWSFPKGGKPPR